MLAFVRARVAPRAWRRRGRSRRRRASPRWSARSRLLPHPVRQGAPHAARAPSGQRVDQQAPDVLDANAGGRNVYPPFGLPEYHLIGPEALRPVLPMMLHEGGPSGPGGMAEKTSVLRRVPSVPRASLRSSPSRWKPARSATRAWAVQRVATDLHAFHPQGVEGEGRYAADRLGRVALSRETGAAPVADLELRHPPVDAVQPAAPDERSGPLQAKPFR
jgi:hypothetical protein